MTRSRKLLGSVLCTALLGGCGGNIWDDPPAVSGSLPGVSTAGAAVAGSPMSVGNGAQGGTTGQGAAGMTGMPGGAVGSAAAAGAAGLSGGAAGSAAAAGTAGMSSGTAGTSGTSGMSAGFAGAAGSAGSQGGLGGDVSLGGSAGGSLGGMTGLGGSGGSSGAPGSFPLGASCQVDRDCASRACDTLSLTCVANSCQDHHRDVTETDADCGGGACPVCSLGRKCLGNTDCASGACDLLSRLCIGDQCQDHRQDGLESDVDCGGTNACPRCSLGKTCQADADCTPNWCDTLTFTCITDSCADHHQSNTESDVDCGGSFCGHCAPGQHCFSNFDCPAGHFCNGIKTCQ